MSWIERSIYIFTIVVLGVALYSMRSGNAELGKRVPSEATATTAGEVTP